MFHSKGRKYGIGISAIALLAATAALSGCSSSSGGSAQGGSKTVIMIPGVSGDPGYDTVSCVAGQVAKKHGVKFSVQAANNFSPAAQTPILQAAIAKHPDAIIIAPTDGTAMEGPIKQAVQAGIKVVLYDSDLVSPSGSSGWVGVDNTAGGKIAGETMAKLINNKGKVMTVNINRGTSTTDGRQDGFATAVQKFPGITYLGTQFNNDDSSVAASQVAASITAHPDMAGVYGTNLTEVEGAVAGVKNANATGKVQVVGFDAAPPEIAAVKRGDIQALVAQDLRDEGTTAMNLALDVMNGKKIKAVNTVGFFPITKDNVDSAGAKAHYYTSVCNG